MAVLAAPVLGTPAVFGLTVLTKAAQVAAARRSLMGGRDPERTRPSTDTKSYDGVITSPAARRSAIEPNAAELGDQIRHAGNHLKSLEEKRRALTQEIQAIAHRHIPPVQGEVLDETVSRLRGKIAADQTKLGVIAYPRRSGRSLTARDQLTEQGPAVADKLLNLNAKELEAVRLLMESRERLLGDERSVRLQMAKDNQRLARLRYHEARQKTDRMMNRWPKWGGFDLPSAGRSRPLVKTAMPVPQQQSPYWPRPALTSQTNIAPSGPRIEKSHGRVDDLWRRFLNILPYSLMEKVLNSRRGR